MTLGLNYDDFSIRPVEIADASMMLDWRNSDHVREGMFHSRQFTMEEQLPWLKGVIDSDGSHYYILSFKDRPFAVFGVYDIKPDQRVGEWVYFSAPREPDMPKGVGAAGEFIAIDTFFYRHRIRRLWGRALRKNHRVWKMHERFGFRIEGSLREHIDKDGELIDVIVVGLLEAEWRSGREMQFNSIFSSGGLPTMPVA